MNKLLEITIKALLKEFVVDSIDDLLILLAQKGIHIGIKMASDIYYNWQFEHRKQIEYKPLDNPNIKVAPATDIKSNHNNTYC